MNQQTVWFTILIVIVGSLILVAGSPRNPQGQEVTLSDTRVRSDRDSLQIDTFGTEDVSRAPIPTSTIPSCPKYVNLTEEQLQECKCGEFAYCVYDQPQTRCPTPIPGQEGIPMGPERCSIFLGCYLDEPYCKQLTQYGFCVQDTASPGCNEDFENGECTVQCVAKPVIYLYPTQKTLVDVKLEIPGYVYISDPLYPENGWQNVEAYPDGTLYYQEKQYPYLYYETAVRKPKIPEEGFVYKMSELTIHLDVLLTKLGLIDHEKRDFLEYWIPHLQALKTPYLFVTLLGEIEKNRIDKVLVNPEPDTRIELIFEFIPLKQFKEVKPLVLPQNPTERKGFTMVEWGGAINQ